MHFHEDILEGYWNQFKGAIQSEWGYVTDDDLTRVAGDARLLYGVLQEKYGLSVDQARDQVDKVVARYDDIEAQGQWTQFKGKARMLWGDLTDDDFEKAQGRRTYLAGLIAERYGHSRAEAWKKIDELLARD